MPNNIAGERFWSDVEKFYGQEGGRRREGVLRFSVGKLLSRSTHNFRRGTLLCSRKFLVSKNFMDKKGEEGKEGGSIKILRRNFFVSKCRKISLKNLSVFQKVSGIEKC